MAESNTRVYGQSSVGAFLVYGKSYFSDLCDDVVSMDIPEIADRPIDADVLEIFSSHLFYKYIGRWSLGFVAELRSK